MQKKNPEIVSLPDGGTVTIARPQSVASTEQIEPEPTPPVRPAALDQQMVATGFQGRCATISELVERFRAESHHLAKSTRKKFECHFKSVARHLNFRRSVASIRLADLRELRSKLSEKRSPGTVNDILFKGLKAVFELVMDDGMIERSPLERLKRLRVPEPERRVITWAQARQMAEDVGRYARESGIIITLMYSFGIGQAEIRELRGQDFDWARGVIHFRRRKTGRLFQVPIFDHAQPFLQKLREWGRFRVGRRVVKWRNPRRALESACKRLNIPRCEPRALRRCFIVHALEAGVDPRVIARWQGHRDAKLIFSVYGKYVDAGYEEREIRKLCFSNSTRQA